MKLAALKNTDPWFGRMQDALAAGKTEAMVLKDVPVDSVVHVEDADVQFDGPEKGHRPWMRISGVLGSMVPEIPMPYGIEELTFTTSPSTVMDYRYDFTEEQLAQLVLDKGMFRQELRPIADVTGIDWELPSTVDMLVVAPETAEDTPLVFVDIHDQNSRSIDEEVSGYDLVEYFVDIAPEQGVGSLREDLSSVPTRTDEIEDLFAQDTMDDITPERDEPERVAVPIEAPVARSAFQELVDAANARRQELRRATSEELSRLDPSRAEAVYQDRMAGLVEAALAEQSGSVEPAEVGLGPIPDANDAVASREAAQGVSEPVQEREQQVRVERSETARRIQREIELDEQAQRRATQGDIEFDDDARPGDIDFD